MALEQSRAQSDVPVSTLATRGEIYKLSILLNIGTARLASLGDLPPERVRHLRSEISARQFDERHRQARRLTAVARLTPPRVAAFFGQHLCGSLLCAAAAGRLATQRAHAVARWLDDGFLAELIGALDPRRDGELLGTLPPQRCARLAAVLLKRGDLASLARLLDAQGAQALGSVLDAIGDDAALLRVIALLESQPQIQRILDRLPPMRLQDLLLVPSAKGAADLWPQALWLMSVVDESRRAVLGHLLAGQEGGVLDGLIDTVQKAHLWPELMPLLGGFGEAAQRALFSRPSMQTPDVAHSLIDAAYRESRWAELTGMLRAGGDPLQRSFAKALTGVGQAVLLGMITAMLRYNLAERVVPLLLRLDPSAMATLAKAAASLPAPLALQLEKQLLMAGAGQALAAVRSVLPKLP